MHGLKAQYKSDLTEAGCDEAGRGCLAGPVVAAAVIFPKGYKNELLNDSKKVSAVNRSQLKHQIIKDALAFSIEKIDVEEIDKINILNASIKAMHLAIGKLLIEPDFLIIDGNRFKKYGNIPHKCIVKGDGKYLSIAAASILAKTYRDEFMLRLHNEHPFYGWNNNKGYPTIYHKEAIQQYGLTKYHRKSFNYNLQLKIGF